MLIKTILELIVVAFVIYAVFNEDKFIAFEDKLKEIFKRSK